MLSLMAKLKPCNVPLERVQVIAPDVGGGFGSKIFHYAEEALVTWGACVSAASSSATQSSQRTCGSRAV